MAKNLTIIKIYKPTDSGNSVNLSHKNMKKTTPWYIITKLLKTSCKEKFLKTPRENRHVIHRNKDKGDVKFLIGNIQHKPETLEKCLLSTQRKKQLTLNCVPGKNTFQKRW